MTSLTSFINMSKLKHSFSFKSKRCLLFSQGSTSYHKAMLKDKDDKTERLERAARVREAINSLGRGGKTRIADACDITPQAITGWLSTGKIDKDHIAVVAEITGYRLHWLITGNGIKTEKEYAEKVQRKSITDISGIEKPSHIDSEAIYTQSTTLDQSDNNLVSRKKISSLMAVASPRTHAVLEAIEKAYQEGRLTEDDLKLLDTIARRLTHDPDRTHS